MCRLGGVIAELYASHFQKFQRRGLATCICSASKKHFSSPLDLDAPRRSRLTLESFASEAKADWTTIAGNCPIHGEGLKG